MNKANIKLGQIVREYREKAGMTQLQLSQKLGYQTTQFVSLFERGLSKIPAQTIGKLVILLGIPEKKITKSLVDGYAAELVSQINQGKKSVS